MASNTFTISANRASGKKKDFEILDENGNIFVFPNGMAAKVPVIPKLDLLKVLNSGASSRVDFDSVKSNLKPDEKEIDSKTAEKFTKVLLNFVTYEGLIPEILSETAFNYFDPDGYGEILESYLAYCMNVYGLAEFDEEN